MNVRNAIVQTDPFVSLIVGSHAVVKIIASFLDELGKFDSSLLVFGILADVVHL